MTAWDNAKGRHTVLIAQARMGSSRLPGKVMEPLAGLTVLEHVIARASRIRGVDEICVATTTAAQDDLVAEVAERAGVAVFRGSAGDVLDRYRGAAAQCGAGVIMRVTSDCPLIDPAVCDAVLSLRETRQADYASNNLSREWPHGLDCEAFTRDALEQAASQAVAPYDREHVTPWLRRAPGLRRAHLSGPGSEAAAQRWTLDYPEDLIFFRTLFSALKSAPEARWEDVYDFVRRHPEISELNASRVASG